jgi:hypothetical protein
MNNYLQAKNEGTTEVLANVATVDRIVMGKLTNVIADLTSQPSARDNKITLLKVQQ